MAVAIIVALSAVGCGGEVDVTRPDPGWTPPVGPPPLDTVPPTYVVQAPAGKLPWPHHNPAWSQQEYDRAMADLWVINNFGLYQGGNERSSVYLHDGLDPVLVNGTPIYAVKPGTVRFSNELWGMVLIEDRDEPGYAWGYAHVNNIRAQIGDEVPQGAHIADVNFDGLDHLHLDRLRLRAGGEWWRWSDLVHLQPDTFFAYTDTEAPVFEGPFRYVREGTDSAFQRSGPGVPISVSGDVDIVVGLRDPGAWARTTEPRYGSVPYGDYHTPNRIEFEISDDSGIVVERTTSFSLSDIALPGAFATNSDSKRMGQALSIYQFYYAADPPPPLAGSRRFNFFVVTNIGGMSGDGELVYGDRGGCWRTAARDSANAPLFPNGDYVVTVYAYDFKDNEAMRSDTVRVAN